MTITSAYATNPADIVRRFVGLVCSPTRDPCSRMAGTIQDALDASEVFDFCDNSAHKSAGPGRFYRMRTSHLLILLLAVRKLLELALFLSSGHLPFAIWGPQRYVVFEYAMSVSTKIVYALLRSVRIFPYLGALADLP